MVGESIEKTTNELLRRTKSQEVRSVSRVTRDLSFSSQ